MRLIIGLATIIAGTHSGAFASPPKKIDIENLSAQQALDARVVDIAFSFASLQPSSVGGLSADEMVARVEASARHALATLYYPVDLSALGSLDEDEKLRTQISAFEAALDKNLWEIWPADEPRGMVVADGVLSNFEYGQLIRIANLQTLTPVLAEIGSASGLRVSITSLGEYGFANARGTWVMTNDTIAYPLNIVTIDCSSFNATCEVSEVDLVAPRIKPGGMDNYLAHVPRTTDTYDVTRWGDTQIEARSQPPFDGKECRFTTLTLNSRSNTVTMITQDAGKPCEVFGTEMPPITVPRVTVLRPTEAAFADHYEKLFDFVELLQGPLAKTAYNRPYVGSSGPTQ